VTYDDFINKELILFSMADNIRSIPSVVDGLKPGQRKVIYGCYLKKIKAEIKVAQLAGFVSEKTAYHHGEVSLVGTIVGLAQDYVGSNNVNLLTPAGQYGTRHEVCRRCRLLGACHHFDRWLTVAFPHPPFDRAERTMPRLVTSSPTSRASTGPSSTRPTTPCSTTCLTTTTGSSPSGTSRSCR
jgi:hypothetical protein